MSSAKISGVYTKVAHDHTPGGADGIAFGAINGKLVIGITHEGHSYFVALGGDVLDAASHKLADALHQIASLDCQVATQVTETFQ